MTLGAGDRIRTDSVSNVRDFKSRDFLQFVHSRISLPSSSVLPTQSLCCVISGC